MSEKAASRRFLQKDGDAICHGTAYHDTPGRPCEEHYLSSDGGLIADRRVMQGTTEIQSPGSGAVDYRGLVQ